MDTKVLGSYSHQALTKQHGNSKDLKAISYKLSENVIYALINEEIDYAYLPIENSIIGNIDINAELIQKENVFAISEFYFPINH